MITITCDGSCLSNGQEEPRAGYAAIIRYEDGRTTEIFGRLEGEQTNNRAELMAAIVGFDLANASGDDIVTLITDSEYVIKGLTGWMQNWRKNGWKTAAKKPVKNRDLWEKLFDLTNGLSIMAHHVTGHSGDPEQERCDWMAKAGAQGYPSHGT